LKIGEGEKRKDITDPNAPVQPFQNKNIPTNKTTVGSTATNNTQVGQQPGNGTNAGTPGNNSSGVASPAITGDVLLQGLVNVNAGNVNAKAGDLINVNTALNNAQQQALMASLNGNVQAQTNAQSLTQRLQQNGLLQKGQSVIGVGDGKIYITGTAR
jgi:hypothetical protein